MSETVTRLRATAGTNGYGDAAADWTNPDQVTIRVRQLEPRPSNEPTPNARNSVIDGWTLYLWPGADITFTDRVIVRGLTYEVIGNAADWRIHGTPRGLVVQLQEVKG